MRNQVRFLLVRVHTKNILLTPNASLSVHLQVRDSPQELISSEVQLMSFVTLHKQLEFVFVR